MVSSPKADFQNVDLWTNLTKSVFFCNAGNVPEFLCASTLVPGDRFRRLRRETLHNYMSKKTKNGSFEATQEHFEIENFRAPKICYLCPPTEYNITFVHHFSLPLSTHRISVQPAYHVPLFFLGWPEVPKVTTCGATDGIRTFH